MSTPSTVGTPSATHATRAGQTDLRGRVSSLASIVVPAVAIALLAVLLFLYFQRGFIPGDAHNYLAAGERLNAGHDLYALQAGDRYVALKPPYWTVPLLSPPPIAVIWRPLAALPNEIGVALWWAGAILSMVVVLLLLLRARPVLAGLAIAALVIPITYEIGVGNVNAFLLLGVLAFWWLAVTGRDQAAGALLAVLVAVKLTPIVFLIWAIGQGRWRLMRAFVIAGAVCLAVSVAGAGLDAHRTYLEVIRTTTGAAASELSLAGVGRALGIEGSVADLLPAIALIVGCGLLLLLRGRPAAAFAVASVTLVVGWPVININTPALLLAALAPLAWPPRPVSRPEALRTPEVPATA